MKAKVIRKFKDKENKYKFYKADSVFEGDKKRVEYLQKTGFVGKEIKEKKKTTKEGE